MVEMSGAVLTIFLGEARGCVVHSKLLECGHDCNAVLIFGVINVGIEVAHQEYGEQWVVPVLHFQKI